MADVSSSQIEKQSGVTMHTYSSNASGLPDNNSAKHRAKPKTKGHDTKQKNMDEAPKTPALTDAQERGVTKENAISHVPATKNIQDYIMKNKVIVFVGVLLGWIFLKK